VLLRSKEVGFTVFFFVWGKTGFLLVWGSTFIRMQSSVPLHGDLLSPTLEILAFSSVALPRFWHRT